MVHQPVLPTGSRAVRVDSWSCSSELPGRRRLDCLDYRNCRAPNAAILSGNVRESGINVGIDHSLVDLARDIISAVAAGFVLMVVGGWARSHRTTAHRLDKHAVEIRHTQKAVHIRPFYNDEL